jgi:hypothetical protein
MMLEDVINTALDARLINLHTAIPCEVVSVDYSTQTVSVKIVVHRITADDTVLPYEVINEVPIGYTQTKKYNISFPIEAGDTGQLIFNERQLDKWIVNNEIAEPDDTRKHSLSDALFVPIFVSRANNIPSISTSEFEIRTKDNATKIRLNTNGDINLDCVNFTINASGKFTINATQSEFVGGTVKHDGVSIDKTHTHAQGADSAGNTQQVTTVPNN